MLTATQTPPARENVKHKRNTKPDVDGAAGGEIDSHPVTGQPLSGSQHQAFGPPGSGPRIQVISSLECVTRIASQLPPLCLAQFHAIKSPGAPRVGSKTWVGREDWGLTSVLQLRREGEPPACSVPVEKAT